VTASDPKITNPAVAAVFKAYPKPIREKLMFLRKLILKTAAETVGVGELEETLKWGEPSYLTPKTKSGSTVRIDWKEKKNHYAVYFKCTTTLVPAFKKKYPTEFTYEGTRAIVFNEEDRVPVKELADCISLALTYHLRKKPKRR
jgi:uncharacterized protein YdhG (YjbR/CyaY superfamily)